MVEFVYPENQPISTGSWNQGRLGGPCTGLSSAVSQKNIFVHLEPECELIC